MIRVGDRVRGWSSGHGRAVVGVVELVDGRARLALVDGHWCALSDLEVIP